MSAPGGTFPAVALAASQGRVSCSMACRFRGEVAAPAVNALPEEIGRNWYDMRTDRGATGTRKLGDGHRFPRGRPLW